MPPRELGHWPSDVGSSSVLTPAITNVSSRAMAGVRKSRDETRWGSGTCMGVPRTQLKIGCWRSTAAGQQGGSVAIRMRCKSAGDDEKPLYDSRIDRTAGAAQLELAFIIAAKSSRATNIPP
jgi:hypothetical protein